MSEHLPILQIVIPLVSAPVCLLLRRSLLSWFFAMGVSAATLFMAFTLLMRVVDGGTISYELGGWAPPWGIEYRIDLINSFVMLLVSTIGRTSGSSL